MEEMLFKDISYLELWQPFCQAEQNHLCNFGRRCYEEQCCEIILNLCQWFRRCRLKHSYLELWQPSCLWERNHLCHFEILKEGIIGNIHVKLFEIWTSGSGGDVV